MKGLKFLYAIFKKFPLLMGINIVLSLMVGLLGACSLFAITPLIDFIIHPTLEGLSPLTMKVTGAMKTFGLPVTLSGLTVVFLVLTVLSSGLQVFARYSILKAKYIVSKDIMIGTFRDFFNARWAFFSGNRQGMLLNTLTRELDVVGTAFGGMGLLFTGILQMIFFVAVPLYISWQVTLISLGVALLFTIPFILLGKLNYRLGLLNTSTANQLTCAMHENFNLAKLILGFGIQNKGINHLRDVYNVHIKATLKSQILNMAVPILYRPIGVVMIIVAVFAARRFGIPLSEMAVLLVALLQLAQSIGNVTMYRNSLENFFPSYEQIEKLRAQARTMRQIPRDKKFVCFRKSIEMTNLSFAYPGHDRVLENINVSIPKGKMVAFVGKSGVGKSTLVDIIMGFYEPTGGSLMIDDISLHDYDINSYRQRIGYVPQESVLFHWSIRENLLWANPEASDEEIKDACRLAYADEFIVRLPDGYKTLVGDRGVRLSGGQIQRVALARALLRKPELLILDEATSSLDTHSERLIQRAIENIANETTIIVVAHRLSTIKRADCIYVVDKGQVVESGTYAQLMDRSGRFNEMVQLQELEFTGDTTG